MTKEIEIRGCGVEQLHVVALLERKQYESTYRMDNGERNEQEYLNFALFLNKNRYEKGGLEFGLTSIDMELIMDSVTVHDTKEKYEAAKQCWYASKETHQLPTNLSLRRYRDRFYRGPMLNELDDDLSDEMIDYLDERGINDAFADFMMSQAYYLEQQEYINWLRLLRRFSD
ncbi:p22 protein precursor [Strigomonas culicis]|nr:p22 protein precursor [Strigomonas culicis]EPY36319.1 p22 protein precursor [Strigomonas culicis]|eukprot:EPY29620.1 p22 protein precursor [Strigomonas culicis]